MSEANIIKLDHFLRGKLEGDTHGHISVRHSVPIIRAEIGAQEYDQAVTRVIKALRAHPSNGVRFTKSIQTFINTLCNIYAQKVGADTILLDQGVRPWLLHRLKYFDNCKILVSRRDLRDQIVDRYRHSVEDKGFPDEMLKRIKKLSSLPKWLGDERPLKIIWFEDFILDRNVRKEILRFTNLTKRKITTETFNPIASRQNIRLFVGREYLLPQLRRKTFRHLFYRQKFRPQRLWMHIKDTFEYGLSAHKNKAGAYRKTGELPPRIPHSWLSRLRHIVRK